MAQYNDPAALEKYYQERQQEAERLARQTSDYAAAQRHREEAAKYQQEVQRMQEYQRNKRSW